MLGWLLRLHDYYKIKFQLSPIEKGTKFSLGGQKWPPLSRKRSGLKRSGSGHTAGSWCISVMLGTTKVSAGSV